MTTPTPRTDAAIKFVREQFHNDDCPEDHAAYAVAHLGGELAKLERDLAAAREELERVRDKCNEHYMALAAAQEANQRFADRNLKDMDRMFQLEERAKAAERDLAAAQEANAQLVKERDAAFAMSRCECQSEECCRNLVQSQEASQRAEALAEANAKDAERLQYLIDNAYSGLDEDLEEPMAVGMIVGGKVEWPDGVRRLIDAAIDAAREGK